MTLGGIILAAGESRRMGTSKVLLRFQGRSFVEVIAGRMKQAGVGRVLVVVGAGWDRIRRSMDLEGIEWVRNEHYERGQLSSLWCGLGALETESGAVMTLVDHPLVTAGTYQLLINEFRKHREVIVIPTYNGGTGHPLVFGSEHFSKFLEAPLEVGARWVLRRGDVRILRVPVDDAGVRADIDTPEDYRRWIGEGGEV